MNIEPVFPSPSYFTIIPNEIISQCLLCLCPEFVWTITSLLCKSFYIISRQLFKNVHNKNHFFACSILYRLLNHSDEKIIRDHVLFPMMDMELLKLSLPIKSIARNIDSKIVKLETMFSISAVTKLSEFYMWKDKTIIGTDLSMSYTYSIMTDTSRNILIDSGVIEIAPVKTNKQPVRKKFYLNHQNNKISDTPTNKPTTFLRKRKSQQELNPVVKKMRPYKDKSNKECEEELDPSEARTSSRLCLDDGRFATTSWLRHDPSEARTSSGLRPDDRVTPPEMDRFQKKKEDKLALLRERRLLLQEKKIILFFREDLLEKIISVLVCYGFAIGPITDTFWVLYPKRNQEHFDTNRVSKFIQVASDQNKIMKKPKYPYIPDECAPETSPKIANIVTHGSVGYWINVHKMEEYERGTVNTLINFAFTIKLETIIESEKSKDEEYKTLSAAIFPNGGYIITGLKSVNNLEIYHSFILNFTKKYQCEKSVFDSIIEY
jgi:hypothetical protein